jgi:hypothetical protein
MIDLYRYFEPNLHVLIMGIQVDVHLQQSPHRLSPAQQSSSNQPAVIHALRPGDPLCSGLRLVLLFVVLLLTT